MEKFIVIILMIVCGIVLFFWIGLPIIEKILEFIEGILNFGTDVKDKAVSIANKSASATDASYLSTISNSFNLTYLADKPKNEKLRDFSKGNRYTNYGEWAEEDLKKMQAALYSQNNWTDRYNCVFMALSVVLGYDMQKVGYMYDEKIKHTAKGKEIISEFNIYKSAIQEYKLAPEATGTATWNPIADYGNGYFRALKNKYMKSYERYTILTTRPIPKMHFDIPQLVEDRDKTVAKIKETAFKDFKEACERYPDANNKYEVDSWFKRFDDQASDLQEACAKQYVELCIRIKDYKKALRFKASAVPFTMFAIENYNSYKTTRILNEFETASEYAKTALEIVKTSGETISPADMAVLNEIVAESDNPLNTMSILDLMNEAKH